MTSNLSLQRLQDAWKESERHVHYIFQAMSALRSLWPFAPDKYAALTDEQVRDLDQFVFRFSKLQDTVGGRFLPAILDYLGEQYEDKPMIDRLNRLEKLGYLQSAEEWQRIRDISNKFTHDYPDDNEKNAAHINLAFEAAMSLCEILSDAAARLVSEHHEVRLGKPLSNNKPAWIKPGRKSNL